jgi:hypothetical protein
VGTVSFFQDKVIAERMIAISLTQSLPLSCFIGGEGRKKDSFKRHLALQSQV